MTQSPSLLHSVKQLFSFFDVNYRVKLSYILIISLAIALFEIAIASATVLFIQAINGSVNFEIPIVNDWLQTQNILIISALAVGVLYFVKNALSGLELYVHSFVFIRANYDFQDKLLQKYANSKYDDFILKNAVTRMQHVLGDCNAVFMNAAILLASMFSEIIIFIALSAFVVWFNPYLTFFILGFVSVTVVILKLYLLPMLYRFSEGARTSGIERSKHILQFFHGFKEIILLGKIHQFVERFQDKNKDVLKLQAKQKFVAGVPRLILELLFIEIFIVIILFASFASDNSGDLLTTISGYMYAAFRLTPGINRIASYINTFKTRIPSIENLHREYNSTIQHNVYSDVKGFEFKNSINADQICYRYANTDKDVLKNVSFTIGKGEKIGIVGESGSGKSTLLDCMLGLMIPTSGQLTVDNKHSPHSIQWHKKLGYVPQTIYLTEDSIARNIAFGHDDIDYQRLKKVISEAQLEGLIENLPDKEHAYVGERGILLSGGQRQRIGIARALYNDPEVLIFDEATSALDSNTETEIIKTINDVSKSKTVIMVAHRITTLKNCDRIIELRNGEIKGISTYDEFNKA